ncbi:hypothetical protein JHK82_037722 [Glycine max]|nr:hypothetical protein JHK82_037722 [Glycine max]KAG5131737.1 hypothetical protein JHK84_038134 [Glycine max]
MPLVMALGIGANSQDLQIRTQLRTVVSFTVVLQQLLKPLTLSLCPHNYPQANSRPQPRIILTPQLPLKKTCYSDFLDACLESEDVNENIWTESYVANISNSNTPMAENGKGSSNFHGSDAAGTIMDYNENLVLENDDFGFLVALQPTATTENFWTDVYAADMSLVPNELLAPWVNESEEYFSSMYDADLWCQTNFHDLHLGLFH